MEGLLGPSWGGTVTAPHKTSRPDCSRQSSLHGFIIYSCIAGRYSLRHTPAITATPTPLPQTWFVCRLASRHERHTSAPGPTAGDGVGPDGACDGRFAAKSPRKTRPCQSPRSPVCQGARASNWHGIWNSTHPGGWSGRHQDRLFSLFLGRAEPAAASRGPVERLSTPHSPRVPQGRHLPATGGSQANDAHNRLREHGLEKDRHPGPGNTAARQGSANRRAVVEAAGSTNSPTADGAAGSTSTPTAAEKTPGTS